MDDIPKVFEALFECTFHMISKDGEEYPEHRRNFYKMLQATTVHCFPGQPITVCTVGIRCYVIPTVLYVLHCVTCFLLLCFYACMSPELCSSYSTCSLVMYICSDVCSYVHGCELHGVWFYSLVCGWVGEWGRCVMFSPTVLSVHG